MTAGQEHYLDAAFDKGLQLTFPPVLVQLLRALLDPSPSFQAISRYLQMDPMLASRILHIVNSSTYGFNSRITDLERAAIAIGTNELFKLVIALSLQKRLAPKNKREPEHEFGDWRMTLWSAIAAEAIASRICPAQKQEAYLAGMLKDLPLYLELCREETPPFLARPRLVTLPWPGQLAEELAYWGYSHPELTRDIFLYWGLPIELAEAIRQHHDITGRSSHSRLAQSVIYATRWSELLHAPGADPAQVVAFEFSMAAELDLDMESAATFRSTCAAKFNTLLAQLGVQPEEYVRSPLHEQPLQTMQRAYFLALGVLSESAPLSPQALAATIQRYLRLFWTRTTFEFFLNLSGGERGSLFRSSSGSDLSAESIVGEKHALRPGWLRIPLAGKEREYGFLALPRSSVENADENLLLMFMRVLGLHLEERIRSDESVLAGRDCRTLPFALARLDAEGVIRDVSRRFESLFGPPGRSPVGMRADALLSTHFAACPSLGGKTAGESSAETAPEQGWLVPTKQSPGLPVYMGLSPDPAHKGDSCLVLGTVTRANPLQTLALAHDGLVETLFRMLRAHVFLLTASGAVVWADAAHRNMLGVNIFTLSKPTAPPQAVWNPAFLSSLTGPVKMKALVAADAGPQPHELTFAPVRGSRETSYLMLMSPAPARKEGA